MVSVWVIARVELTRMLRDRSNIFFVFVFPLLLVVLIGAQFGGSMDLRVGVVVPAGDAADGPTGDLLDAMDAIDGVATSVVDDRSTLRDEVTRGLLSAGVVLPDDYDDAVRDATSTTVGFVGRPDATAMSLRQLVATALADQTAPGTAARLASTVVDGDPGELRDTALELQDEVAGVEVVATTLGTDELGEEFAGLGQFDLGASSQLFLFTFLTAMSGGVALIQTRQYGVARRMLSTSTPVGAIVGGQVAGRFLVAATQAAYIVVATWLLFRVDWGDAIATTVVVGLFCVVSAAAGLLLGATLRNDSQAGGVSVGLGLGLAALGGSMAPLEIFPDTMRTVALVTPHAWANEAMAELVRRDGGLGDILPQIGALAGFAIVLLGLGTVALQRTLTR
jgi:ABC-2 type transport system permease protein